MFRRLAVVLALAVMAPLVAVTGASAAPAAAASHFQPANDIWCC